MPRTADTIPFAEFVERIPLEDWRRFWDAGSKVGRSGLELYVNGETNGYTAVYNVNKGVESCAKGEPYSLGTKEYNGDVVLQPGIKGNGASGRMDTLSDAIRRFNDGEPMTKVENGGNTPAAAPSPAPTAPVAASGAPQSVDPELIDAVASMFTRTQAAIASGPTEEVPAFDNGRDFLRWMWDNTPEAIRGKRVADIVRGVLDGAESAAKRGLFRKLIDDIRVAFDLGDNNDYYGKLFNLLPDREKDGSKEQIASIVGRTYLFNADADAFRLWSVQIQMRATMMQQMLGNFSPTIDTDTHNRAAVLHAAQCLDGISKGLASAQARYEEYTARQLASVPAPVEPLSKVEHDKLPAAVQENLPADIWNELPADKQRQILVNRGVVETENGWRMRSEVEAAPETETAPPAEGETETAPETASPPAETETASAAETTTQQRRRR